MNFEFIWDYFAKLKRPLRYFLIVGLLWFSIFFCSAQSVTHQAINSAGGTSTISGNIYEWNIGEMALVNTMLTPQLSLTNGFLQPLPPLFIITPQLFVAASNVLSPNGDGSNDAWVIKDLDRYAENELTIMDRGGRVVYNTKNYQNNWTGDINDLPLAEDTYFYILILRKGGRTANQWGFISLIR